MRWLTTLAGLVLALAINAEERFETVDVIIDSPAPVAAWQVEIKGRMTLVGVENGEHAAYPRAPFYDRDAAEAGALTRVLVADYSTADELPRGSFRVATLHVLKEEAASLDGVLVVAAQPDGRPIDARISIRHRGETP